jgi:peptide/nickel transport system permease protein
MSVTRVSRKRRMAGRGRRRPRPEEHAGRAGRKHGIEPQIAAPGPAAALAPARAEAAERVDAPRGFGHDRRARRAAAIQGRATATDGTPRAPLLAFVLRRILQSAAVMAVVALIAFGLFNFTGDPVASMVGPEATLEDRARLRADLGLDQPFWIQFGHFVGNAAQGEFGRSLRQGRKVSALLKERLPATLELSLAAAVLALVVGIPLGVYTALRRNTWLSQLLLAGSLIGVSLPTFLIGILLILVFAVILGWLPSFGRGDTVALGWWTTGLLTASGLKALILPAITLSLFQMTLIMRLVRAEMLEVLRTDYIKFARARGLSDRTIHFGHALKNTLVPVITITGLQLGAIIAFAIITETVFQWPGMGLLFIQAVNFADIPVMAAYLCFIALVFVTLNLIVDLLYYAVDPRLRIERTAAH